MDIDYNMFDTPFIYDKRVDISFLFGCGTENKLKLLNSNNKMSRFVLFYFIYRVLNNRDFNVNVTEFGKPYLTDYPNLHFNLSHSGNKIVFILCKKTIGIDMEITKNITLNGKERFFCEDEWIYINSSKNSLSAFYEIWTLKEAYLKYLGTGLNKPLKTIRVHVISNNKYVVYDNEDNLKLVFNSFEFFDEFKYRISICSENEVSPCVINLN